MITGKLKRFVAAIGGENLYRSLAIFKARLYELLFGKKNFAKRKKFYSAFIQPNDLCYDVGANVGNRVEVLLSIGAKVIAIEPQPSCVKTLRKKFDNSITIVPKGVGAKSGVLDFYMSTNSTLSTFDKGWIDEVKGSRFEGNSWNNVQRMEITTLNDVIQSHGKPHFIKIDVEGFELEVLSGLDQAVNYISIEYAVPERLEKLTACLEKLKSLDNMAMCNYSVGETMGWALSDWIPINDMIRLLHTPAFISTDFGDIYIKSNG